MTPLGKSKHVAARMGRWSASHWKTATFGWIAFVVAAFAIGAAISTKNIDEKKAGSGESGHVTAVLADEFKQSQVEDVLVQSSSAVVSSPAFRRAIADVTAMLQKQKAVYDIESPLVTRNDGQISRDRHSALVSFKNSTGPTWRRPTRKSLRSKRLSPASRSRIPSSSSASSAARAPIARSTRRSARGSELPRRPEVLGFHRFLRCGDAQSDDREQEHRDHPGADQRGADVLEIAWRPCRW